MKTDTATEPIAKPATEHPARRTQQAPPNALRSGNVTRTLWPPAAGTQKWQQQFGTALLCVRHRQDAAGLRRVVTVELVVGAVKSRKGQTGIQPRARYPVKLPETDHPMSAALKLRRAWWDAESECWYAYGKTIQELHLEDHIWMKKRLNRRKK